MNTSVVALLPGRFNFDLLHIQLCFATIRVNLTVSAEALATITDGELDLKERKVSSLFSM